MDEMHPAVLENRMFDSRGKFKKFRKFRLLRSWSFRISEPFSKKVYWMMLFNYKNVEWSLDEAKFRQWFWKKSKLKIQSNHTKLPFLASSVYQVCTARNQTPHLIFLYVFKDMLKSWPLPWWIKCSHWFLGKAGLLFTKNQATSAFWFCRSIKLAMQR